MRAAIFDAPFEMHVGSWDLPQPGPGEVLVSVGATGICAGDMYLYLGKNPYAIYPQIAGHEIAGVVTGVGSGVTGLELGTPVVVLAPSEGDSPYNPRIAASHSGDSGPQ